MPPTAAGLGEPRGCSHSRGFLRKRDGQYGTCMGSLYIPRRIPPKTENSPLKKRFWDPALNLSALFSMGWGWQPKAYASILRFRSNMFTCILFLFVSLIWIYLYAFVYFDLLSSILCLDSFFICADTHPSNTQVDVGSGSGTRSMDRISLRYLGCSFLINVSWGVKQFWEKIDSIVGGCQLVTRIGLLLDILFRKLLGSVSIWYVQIPS